KTRARGTGVRVLAIYYEHDDDLPRCEQIDVSNERGIWKLSRLLADGRVAEIRIVGETAAAVGLARMLVKAGKHKRQTASNRLGREELERLSALFATDKEFVETMVHERKRAEVEGLPRGEILDRMASDYTYVNRPVVVRGRSVACGPLRLNRERYDALFGDLA